MNETGIYKIQSKLKTNRCYVGSAVNFKERRREHLKLLRGGRHHSIKLQRHYDKYGENDLIFSLIIGCDKEALIVHEQFYIDALSPYFNICRYAGNTIGQRPMLGKKCSDETKKKISIANKGRKHPYRKRTPEQIEKTRQALLGRKRTPEAREKMSLAKKGKKLGPRGPITEETRRKMSISQKGNRNALGAKRSPETIMQMSLRMKGKPSCFKGRHMTSEHKTKMIATRKRNKLLKEQAQNIFSHV